MEGWRNEGMNGLIYSSHHRLTGEDVWVVFPNELLHPLLPHPEHLGAFVVHEGELLQHDVSGGPDLIAQVELRRLWLRIKLCSHSTTLGMMGVTSKKAMYR